MSIHRLIAFGSDPDIYDRPTPEEVRSALKQIHTARQALYRVDYWLDTDDEILRAMSRDELAAHNRLRGIIKEGLDALK